MLDNYQPLDDNNIVRNKKVAKPKSERGLSWIIVGTYLLLAIAILILGIVLKFSRK